MVFQLKALMLFNLAESGIHTGITSAAIVATIPITHRDTAAITHSSSHTHLTGSLCHELDRLPRSSSDGLHWPSRILPTRRSLISLNGKLNSLINITMIGKPCLIM